MSDRTVAGSRPAATRDAATVALVRAGSAGPEVYLMRRVATMAFAAGLYVFPGGSVDPRDSELPDEAWSGPVPEAWAGRLSADLPLTRALVCAAVRETFEECGVLLAGRDSDSIADVSAPDWEDDRQALLDRSLSMAALLARRGLVLRADLLRPWAHWITPEVEPRRFDTRFFVAALPGDQRPRDVGGEADRVAWMRPVDALEAGLTGQLGMLPPTIAVLRSLAAHSRVADLLAAEPEISPIMPRIVTEGESWRVVLPGDPGYAEAAG